LEKSHLVNQGTNIARPLSEPSGSLAPQQIAAAKATPVKARIVADGQYASAPALKRCKPNE
jgi:hypothetical protein